MCMTYYTVDDLRPGRPGWDVRQFSALAEAIDHYRTLPMDGTRVLGMADDGLIVFFIALPEKRLPQISPQLPALGNGNQTFRLQQETGMQGF